MLFFVDAMLGNIARKLRLFGYDTEYFSDIEDHELLEKAKNENRTIISKDGCLIRRAKKKGIQFIGITTEDEIEQFKEILKKTNLEINKISGDLARCTKCNFQTFQIKKSEIQNKIPKRVLDYHDKFWKCGGCDQIYWEGTHIEKLQEFVQKIKCFI
ncbi:Mut7-C RNAse domain-containing protein [Nitrosopumilus sp.]|uniref:Mut7-C RNAse domain-containing protein n=1 Tax=Nitrosopumilus sp. TaxID=2024843 RepID=UPI00247EA0DD|nr:Mut7-C RNAse domain-containing protein [Nitrosopumilus sp.]MCV0410133.1 Mut7-C RNAse domain-containing protein [Nitrosopumilus sp.]